VGVSDTAVPVPESEAVCGLPDALSVTESVATREPVADGVKVTLIVQFAPAPNVVPQVVVRAKSLAFVPVMLMLLIIMLALPLFESVTARTALVVFVV
jgi:hypothetical protein